jgi:lipoprotein
MKTIQTNQKTYATTYAVAASWLGCKTILCNEITKIDDELMHTTIGYDYDEEVEEYPEVHQYYLTNCNEPLCEFLNEHFGLMFAYSEKLKMWVLLVDHYGFEWHRIEVYTDISVAAAPLGTRKLN